MTSHPSILRMKNNTGNVFLILVVAKIVLYALPYGQYAFLYIILTVSKMCMN
jgi:hypothetical protein